MSLNLAPPKGENELRRRKKKEIKGLFPSARLHSMGSFLKGIIEVCVFLLRFVLVNFSGVLRQGGVVCPPSPSALGKKLGSGFFF